MYAVQRKTRVMSDEVNRPRTDDRRPTTDDRRPMTEGSNFSTWRSTVRGLRSLELITHYSSLLPGEENGRSDSVVRHCNGNTEAHRRFSRRPLCLPKRQAFTALLSNAVGLS